MASLGLVGVVSVNRHTQRGQTHQGDYTSIESEIDDIFAYHRSSEGHDTFLILLNFGTEAHTLNLSHLAETATIAVASDMMRSGEVALAELAIGAHEGLILRLR